MPIFWRRGTSKLPIMYPRPASPVTATQYFWGEEIFAAMVAARLNPSEETLPHPRNPRGTKVSYTVLSWSLVLPDSWVTKELRGSSTSISPA